MSRHVLVVDDDENSCRALSMLLRSAGYRVSACTSPERALEILLAENPDVLVTDHIMDDMNGLELVEASRAYRSGLRCVVVSGQQPSEEERLGVAWIEKPVDAEVLLAALEDPDPR